MTAETEAALITVALTIIAGIAGYSIREFRYRMRPLVSITRVEGNIRRNPDRVNVPEQIVEKLQKSFSVTKLASRDTLSEVFSAWDEADDLVIFGEDTVSLLDQLIASCNKLDKDAFIPAFSKLLLNKAADRWLTTLIALDRIVPTLPNQDLPILISTYPSSDNGGCIWFDFGPVSTYMGTQLDQNQVRSNKVTRFATLIEHLDFEALAQCFQTARREIMADLLIARDAAPDLKQLLNDNSRWGFQVYLANLGKTPFLVQTTAEVNVHDETGASFDEPCHLVLRITDNEGGTSRKTAESPLVIRSESDATFLFLTTKTQGSMTRGKAFRDAFTSEEAQCLLLFQVEKPGFRRFARITTPEVKFREGSGELPMGD